jgi:hypothetical protein
MGCDIHIFSEVKYHGGYWKPWLKSYSGDLQLDCLSNRHYLWFSILAGVRSGGNSIKPIAANRGIPEGISKEVLDGMESYHSQTWCTLEEMAESLMLVKKYYEDNADEDSYEDEGEEIKYESSGLWYPDNVNWHPRYNNENIEPVIKEYEEICALAEFLDIPIPEVRLVIGFDS